MKNLSKGLYNIIDNDGIKRSINNVLKENIDFNTYTTPKGLKELREEICKFKNSDSIYSCKKEDIIITSCSQQSINLIADILLDDGDTILIEQPTYYGALDVFKKKKNNLLGFDINNINLDNLEKIIINYKPKLIYVVPTFNNPTGYVWQEELRLQFLEIINRYDVIVIEDDPYSLINFTDRQYHSLYELNKGEKVIYLGTFSKYISPSINVGYIICSKKNIINKIYEYKECYDLCTSLFVQYVVLDYLRCNDLKESIRRKLIDYKIQKDKMIKLLLQLYGDKIESYTKMDGGLFFLVRFKDNIDTELFDDGGMFYIDGCHNNEARINICSYF